MPTKCAAVTLCLNVILRFFKQLHTINVFQTYLSINECRNVESRFIKAGKRVVDPDLVRIRSFFVGSGTFSLEKHDRNKMTHQICLTCDNFTAFCEAGSGSGFYFDLLVPDQVKKRIWILNTSWYNHSFLKRLRLLSIILENLFFKYLNIIQLM